MNKPSNNDSVVSTLHAEMVKLFGENASSQDEIAACLSEAADAVSGETAMKEQTKPDLEWFCAQLEDAVAYRDWLAAEGKSNRAEINKLRAGIAAIRKSENDKKRQRYAFITESGETPFEVRRKAMADARAAFVHRMVNYGMTIADVAKALKLSRASVERMHRRRVPEDASDE